MPSRRPHRGRRERDRERCRLAVRRGRCRAQNRRALRREGSDSRFRLFGAVSFGNDLPPIRRVGFEARERRRAGICRKSRAERIRRRGRERFVRTPDEIGIRLYAFVRNENPFRLEGIRPDRLNAACRDGEDTSDGQNVGQRSAHDDFVDAKIAGLSAVRTSNGHILRIDSVGDEIDHDGFRFLRERAPGNGTGEIVGLDRARPDDLFAALAGANPDFRIAKVGCPGRHVNNKRIARRSRSG